MKDLALYSLLRIVLFVALASVVAAITRLFTEQVSILWVLVATAVLSVPASWFLLRGPRERVAANLQARQVAASERLERMRSAEDDDD